jgi:tRNA pseudouridine38-40 synthase
MNDFSWTLTMPLDAAAMNASCGFLLGRHDFTSFSKLHTDVKTNYCEIFEAGWTVYPGMIVFRVRADRFLRNMVRAIVGTQVAVGKGRLKPDGVQAVMNALDRSKAGMSVPAKGLFLTRVEYDPDIFAVQARSPFSAWF